MIKKVTNFNEVRENSATNTYRQYRSYYGIDNEFTGVCFDVDCTC